MDSLIRDVRFAWSLLLRRRAATAVTVVSLALGIGANVTVFGVANALYYRPLPVADPASLVRVFTMRQDSADLSHSTYMDYVELRDRVTAFESVAAYFYFPMGLSVNGSAEVVLGQLSSANYFEVMGVSPSLGRAFRPEEDRLPGGDDVVVVSHRLWTRRFGADPAILGRTVLINSYPFTVIGVAPEGFTAPNVIVAPDVWVPVTTLRKTLPYPISLQDRYDTWLVLAGRLKEGQTLAAAQSATDAVAAALAREYPDSNRDRRFRLIEANRVRVGLIGTTDTQKQAMTIILVVVGLVLLVACLNVANLNLASAIDRRKEIALRHSLGASRRRLLRQLLTESVLVAVLAGGLGLLFAVWTIDALRAILQATIVEMPVEIDARIDWRTLGFGALAALASAMVFGLAPAIQALRQSQYAALKDSAAFFGKMRGVFRAQSGLVIAQVSLSFVLLASAGLFLRSLGNTLAVDPGFDIEHSVIVPIDLGFGRYDEATGRPFMRRLVDEIGAIPGVESVSLAADLPLGQMHMRSHFETDGLDDDHVSLRSNVVGPRYFETMGIPILSGRAIDERDREGAAPSAVVNEALARRFWPGEDPIGRTFRSNDVTWTVVGVARDGKYDSLAESPQPFLWLSMFQATWLPRVNVHIRTGAAPEALLQATSRAVQALDPNLPIQRAMTTRHFFQNAIENTAGPARVLAVLGLFAFALAVVGTYGLMSYLTSRRRQEFGVRLALGADPGRLTRLVLARGVRLGLAGGAIGLVLSGLVSRMVGNFLFGVRPLDPAVLASVTVLMLIATAAACYAPARAAGRVDPVVTLRAE